MKKNVSLIALAVLLAIQLVIPALAINQINDVCKEENLYTFDAVSIDAYLSSANTCSIYVDVQLMKNSNPEWFEGDLAKYGVLSVDNEGTAHIEKLTDVKPAQSGYLLCNNATYSYYSHSCEAYEYDISNKYYNAASKLNHTYWQNPDALQIQYKMYVKNGLSVAEGVYINGQPIEEYLEGK